MIDEQQLNQFNISRQSPKRRRRLMSAGTIIGIFIGVAICAIIGVIFWRVGHYYKLIKSGTALDFNQNGKFTVSARAANANKASITDSGSIEGTGVLNFGSPKAAITIVQFADFECPFSKEAYPAVREVMTANQNNVKFIFRHFPVAEIHTHALKAAEASQCANDQGKFWVFHDKLYQNQSQIELTDLDRYAKEAGLDTGRFFNCLKNGTHYKEVMQDYEDGLKSGVRGTPTFFVNGQKVEGSLSSEDWEKVLAYFKK